MEKMKAQPAECKHEGTFIWIGKARYLRGYLLTYCLDCEKTINAEAIKMREDAYNPNNRRIQNAALRARAFELFADGVESWQVSVRLGISKGLASRWNLDWRKAQGLAGRKPHVVEL